MPQPSVGYAMARVRVREGTLLSPARLDRLLGASDLNELLRVAAETGIGEGQEMTDAAALEDALDVSVAGAAALLQEISPQPEVTDLFLLRYDAQNVKALIKARALGIDPPPLVAGGLIPREELAAAVRERHYERFPKAFAENLNELERRLTLEFKPQWVDLAVDRALAAEMARRAEISDSETVKRWVSDGMDLQNAILLLRLHDIKANREHFVEALLPGGAVSEEDWRKAWDAPEAMSKLFSAGKTRAIVDNGVRAWREGGGLAVMERDRDDHLIALFSDKKRENFRIEPVIGYLLARERESAVIRLVAMAKARHLPADVVRERLRGLYG